jgi:tetratricopeptide (TPR) repeat protein
MNQPKSPANSTSEAIEPRRPALGVADHRAQRRLALGILGLAGLASAPAHAGEDGGVRSVFAFGAGNRPLALGGAYAAVSDDASAPVWNPGGLGFVQSPEFEGSGASLYGLDVDEEYASIVIPNWRWGAAAFTFRRLAVDGIAERDERGTLLSDDLTDRQTEFMLSYGRTLSDLWSVGGSVKLQRQSIAHSSAGGVGVNIGVLGRPIVALAPSVTWAERVSWGLAIHNIVEPSLEHDAESVTDPTRVRTGLAYAHPVARNVAALAAFDLEKNRNSSVGVHAGLEVGLHELLAVRLGANDGMFTAGAGIRWRRYAFDYVLENNDIEPVHRFGVAIQFGATVEESRRLQLQAEEEAYQARVAKSFEELRARRVEDMVRQVEELEGAGHYDEALSTLGAVSVLEPENPSTKAFEARCLWGKADAATSADRFTDAAILYGQILNLDPDDTRAQAGLKLARFWSDRHAARSAPNRELFASALDAFTQGDLPATRKHLTEILEANPDDDDARAMLARTTTAIRIKTTHLQQQAARFVKVGLLEEAEQAVDEIRALDSEASVADLESLIRAAEQDLAAEAIGEKARDGTDAEGSEGVRIAAPTLSRKKRKELGELYRQGATAMEEGRADDAVKYWELVWSTDPTFESVAEYLRSEYLIRGLEAFATGDLAEATRRWEEALDVDPRDETALRYLTRFEEQMSRTVEILGEPAARPGEVTMSR